VDKTRLIARILWVFPGFLLFLAFNQAKVAYDLRQTWEHGTPATAEVLAYDNANRVDVTYGYVSLRVLMPDGSVIEKDQMSLPPTILPRLEDDSELAVHVRPGAAQELVVDKLMPAHWLIAAGQAGMGLIGFLLFGAGVLWWNRYLRRQPSDVDAV
jgi:hypothetical protein